MDNSKHFLKNVTCITSEVVAVFTRYIIPSVTMFGTKSVHAVLVSPVIWLPWSPESKIAYFFIGPNEWSFNTPVVKTNPAPSHHCAGVGCIRFLLDCEQSPNLSLLKSSLIQRSAMKRKWNLWSSNNRQSSPILAGICLRNNTIVWKSVIHFKFSGCDVRSLLVWNAKNYAIFKQEMLYHVVTTLFSGTCLNSLINHNTGLRTGPPFVTAHTY